VTGRITDTKLSATGVLLKHLLDMFDEKQGKPRTTVVIKIRKTLEFKR
jgi:hypothetical protein